MLMAMDLDVVVEGNQGSGKESYGTAPIEAYKASVYDVRTTSAVYEAIPSFSMQILHVNTSLHPREEMGFFSPKRRAEIKLR